MRRVGWGRGAEVRAPWRDGCSSTLLVDVNIRFDTDLRLRGGCSEEPRPQRQLAILMMDGSRSTLGRVSRTPRQRPFELAPAPWPEIPADDAIAEAARTFVVRLRQAMGTQSTRAVATAAGVHHTTLLGVLAGRSWPDLATLARLELALDAELWRRPAR